jgi:hypothetical protein
MHGHFGGRRQPMQLQQPQTIVPEMDDLGTCSSNEEGRRTFSKKVKVLRTPHTWQLPDTVRRDHDLITQTTR